MIQGHQALAARARRDLYYFTLTELSYFYFLVWVASLSRFALLTFLFKSRQVSSSEVSSSHNDDSYTFSYQRFSLASSARPCVHFDDETLFSHPTHL
jgi:hypothetical protein